MKNIPDEKFDAFNRFLQSAVVQFLGKQVQYHMVLCERDDPQQQIHWRALSAGEDLRTSILAIRLSLETIHAQIEVDQIIRSVMEEED